MHLAHFPCCGAARIAGSTSGTSAMDQILLPLLAGAGAQLLANFCGRGFGATGTVLLLCCGMPPLLALASMHGASLISRALGSLLHVHLGQVQMPASAWLAAGALPGALLGCTLLVVLTTTQQYLLIAISLGTLLITNHTHRRGDTPSAQPGIGRALLAGFSLAVTAAGATLLSRLSHANAALALLLSSAVTLGSLVWLAGASPVLPALGLLAGSVLASPFVPAMWRAAPRAPAIQTDY